MAVQDDVIAPALDPQAEESFKEKTRKRTLGNLRLVHPETNAVILVPTPSSDPNDPLNWSTWRKYYVAGVLCLAMAVCNFLAAGPAIAVPATAADFFPDSLTDGTFYTEAIPKTAYFFTTTSLLMGVGNIVWVPAANKWGRRPVYILSFAIYFATAVWLIFEKSYARYLAGRILMGFGSGAAETLAPITIADVFFLHERGRIMSAYTCFLSVGASGGLVISGLITINNSWRTIYQAGTALVGFVLLALLFTVPETSYSRTDEDASLALDVTNDAATISTAQEGQTSLKKLSYVESLLVFKVAGTSENLFKMMIRPFGLIILPPVLWSALALSVTIGFLVAVSSNSASAFNVTYGFASWQVGLCYIAGVIGSILGLPAGGYLGDKVADILTKRNDGIREPEMRLPAVMISVITTPLALLLYGAGVQYKLHWICPTIGIGLLNFSITQANTICVVYVIDSYRPVAGEITLAVTGFKALFAFFLSFETNPWINTAGYVDAFGAMAGIAGAILIMWIPLYFWGKQIRHNSWNWRVVSFVHWDNDREVGE
ncbi:MFS general substrate transporter [Trichoderma citrinoviride]|uniref:MFS general substrate transporter n=1 Tax=Trichoderma citrinoviride TaxID=58853 RepID=A0A2T4B7K8_9HYPO|nr:MFS general substrate transporter [Trichoderma citrinoviride]PTB65290.1 MFS general substrate transporter [Trichoderma citrinoviride]